MLSASGVAQYTQVVSELAPSNALLPLNPGRQMTIRDKSLHAYPTPGLSLSADTARGSFSDRDKSASQVHKHVKMRLFKTLFYYTGACSSDQE